MQNYKYIYGFQCEGAVVFATLPQIFKHNRKAGAVMDASGRKLNLSLFPASFVLADDTSGEVCCTYTDEPEQRRLVEILIMTEECARRLGKPLGPEDILALKKKGDLESVIFSTAYITHVDKDYKEVDWSVADLHKWLAAITKPDVVRDGQVGFSFESSSFGVTEVNEPQLRKKKAA